jgi:NAD-dependent dihydropyrimidine dehydrogenase PreA subunit
VKDSLTGAVIHLDDACIGCSYCTMTCPYEVPAFNDRLGIVRKGDLCQDRLAEGEAPACVQACPTSAISVRIVEVAELVELSRPVAVGGAPEHRVVPHAPSSRLTVPTTRYRSARGRLDEAAIRPAIKAPAQAHTPLAVMLVLTQLSVGAFVAALVGRAGTLHTLVAIAAGVVALGASTLHLGRPQYAYRAVIGLRHSWLSREVVAFGAFTGLAVLYAAGVLPGVTGWAAAGFGVFGIVCSVLIYTTTHRASWRPSVVTAKFGLTTAIGGAVIALPAAGVHPLVWVPAVAAAIAASAYERSRFFTRASPPR